MKHNYSSQEEILATAKEIIARDGLEHLSMRKLSSECYLALGTLYHYYASKEELLLAVMEDFWKSRFVSWFASDLAISFRETFAAFCDLSAEAYRDFVKTFHDLRVFGTTELVGKAKQKQSNYIAEISQRLFACAHEDPAAKIERFDEKFRLEDFIALLLDAVVFSLMARQDKKEFLLSLIDRTLYGK